MYKSVMREILLWVAILSVCCFVIFIFCLCFEALKEVVILMSCETEIYTYRDLTDAIAVVGVCFSSLIFCLIYIFYIHRLLKVSSPADQKEA